MEISTAIATLHNKVMIRRRIFFLLYRFFYYTNHRFEVMQCISPSPLRCQGLETAFKALFLLIIEFHIEGSLFQ